jgi:hypothetical protein
VGQLSISRSRDLAISQSLGIPIESGSAGDLEASGGDTTRFSVGHTRYAPVTPWEGAMASLPDPRERRDPSPVKEISDPLARDVARWPEKTLHWRNVAQERPSAAVHLPIAHGRAARRQGVSCLRHRIRAERSRTTVGLVVRLEERRISTAHGAVVGGHELRSALDPTRDHSISVASRGRGGGRVRAER